MKTDPKLLLLCWIFLMYATLLVGLFFYLFPNEVKGKSVSEIAWKQ